MAESGKKLSELVDGIPKYHIVKEKVYCPPSRVHSVVTETSKLFAHDEIDLADGVKAERKDGWVQVRASGTEPMIRVIAENKDREKAQEDVDRVLAFVAPLV